MPLDLPLADIDPVGPTYTVLKDLTVGENHLPIFSPESNYLACSDRAGYVLTLWDVSNKKPCYSVEVPARISVIRFFKSREWLLCGCADGTIGIWDYKKGKLKQTLDCPGSRPYSMSCLEVSPRGSFFASGGMYLAIWPAAKLEPRMVEIEAKDRPKDQLSTMAYSADGKKIVATTPRRLRVWDAESGEQLLETKEGIGSISKLVYSPDGKSFATGGTADGKTGQGWVKLWDPATLKHTTPVNAFKGLLYCLAYSPDGKYLLAGGVDGVSAPSYIRVWETSTGKQVNAFYVRETEGVYLAISPDGKQLAVSGYSGTEVRLYAMSDVVSASSGKPK